MYLPQASQGLDKSTVRVAWARFVKEGKVET
jgi:hypothetical protein